MFKNSIHLKKVMFLVPVLCCWLVLSAQNDTLDFPAPQLMLPMYDSFSHNYLNASASARGNTGMALLGGVENALLNPACFKNDVSQAYLDVIIKPPLIELNLQDGERYTSPVPFGMMAVNYKFFGMFDSGLIYSMPKSILYDNFSIVLPTDDFIQRYPSYNLHQLTTAFAGGSDKLRFGLNIHQQLHRLQQIQILHTFDSVEKIYYLVRPQAGVFSSWKMLQLGAAFMPEQKKTLSIKYLEYDTVFPMQIDAGLALKGANEAYLLDIRWEQTGRISDKFKDRLTLKTGYEKRMGKFTYRAGAVSVPEVFRGAYRLPDNTTASADTAFYWNNIPKGGKLGKSEQLFLTAGFTYHFGGGSLSLTLMQDLLGSMPVTQLQSSLAFDLSTFKKKKFLIFE